MKIEAQDQSSNERSMTMYQLVCFAYKHSSKGGGSSGWEENEIFPCNFSREIRASR